MPKIVVADPDLTLGLPPHVTAATGFDALTHNIEAFLSLGYNPMCDGIALEGIALINRALLKAVKEPDNVAARTDMLMASLMGAVAFQKGLGVTHSCAHALSTVYDLHHGLANALMLDACLKFNAETHGLLLCRMGQAIGLGKVAEIGPGDFIEWASSLREKVGIKAGLRNHGVTDIAPLLDVAVNDFCHTENPRPVSRDDFKRIYEAAL